MQSWTSPVQIGTEGKVLFTFSPSPPTPIVSTEVRLGTAVGSAIVGADLRAMAGQKFAVPTAAGNYNLTVTAKNANGCTAVTTAARNVKVQ